MNWYYQSGKNSNVILSSRVRLARNIDGINFIPKATEADKKKVFNLMKDATLSLGYGLKFFAMKDLDSLTKSSLVEKHLISNEFANSVGSYTAVIMNDEENICIVVNEEDHIKLQIYSAGLELENLINLAVEIDENLSKCVNYSYHQKYGYLTACPTNVGTGLKASVLVHLPALAMTGNTRKLLNFVNKLGMSIRGLYGEGTEVEGDLYQISNNQTLGITEKEIIKNLNLISQKVISQEEIARSYLGKKQIELEDELYRNFGLLYNARIISEEEAVDLLSKVKLGTDLGIIKEMNDLKVMKLLIGIRSANLQKTIGKKLSGYDQNIERAKFIKQVINS